jgi:cytochrome c oxidase subunit IV
MKHHDESSTPAPTVGAALVVLLALLILTATTVGLAFLELPPAVHIALAMTIAAIKAALVAAVFMHLLREAPATRLVALMAAILLAIFMLMVTADIRHLGGG